MKMQPQGAKFSIVAHSTGSLVTYKSFEHDEFPRSHLITVYNLGGPLKLAPQLFSKDGPEILQKIISNFPHKDFG